MQIQVIKLANGKKRLIHGDYAEIFKLDYTQSLTELKKDIELALFTLNRKVPKKGVFDFNKKNRFEFDDKDIRVYQGNNHIDIINNGVGSMNWLTIADHDQYND